jgi:hypothetical protein
VAVKNLMYDFESAFSISGQVSIALTSHWLEIVKC